MATSRNFNIPTDENQLLAEWRMYRSILRSAQEGIWMVDLENRTTYANPRMGAILGYTPAEMLGKTFYEFMDRATWEQARTATEKRQQHGEVLIELPYLRKDGTTVWCEVWSDNLYGEDGEQIGAVAFMTDITARRELQRSSLALEERYRALVENLPLSAVLLFDRDLRYTFVGGIEIEATGYNKERMEGQLMRDVLPPDFFQFIHPFLQRTLAGETFTIEVPYDVSAEERIYNLITYAPLREADEGVTGGMILSLNITERKLLEQRQIEAERIEFELAQERAWREQLSQLVTIISHEFRTPLSIIQTSTDLLTRYADRLSPDRQQGHLAKISRQVQQINTMVEEMLTLTKMRDARFEFNPSQVDLIAVVRSIVETVRTMFPQREIALSFRWVRKPALVDAYLMERIIVNLLRNALHYSDDETAVHIALDETDEALLLTVRDEGIGIPAEDIADVTEMFVRGSNVDHRSGTGLGLTMVAQAVHLHHGQMTIESALNEGTTVRVAIPKQLPENA